MSKKKVSFDIDEELLDEIKEFCKGRDLKLSDYFRFASQEKIERDKSFMVIFIPYNGTVEKFEIDTKEFIIELSDASEAMSENVGAVCEGFIYNNPSFASMMEEPPRIKKLKEMLEPNQFNDKGGLAFYTREKYTIKEKSEDKPLF